MNLSASTGYRKSSTGITGRLRGFKNEIFNNFILYSMAIPAVICLLLFNYLPLMGLIIAFKEYKFDGGILGSAWANPILNNFNFLFSSGSAIRAISNTILLNLLFILSGIILEVGLALLLNEITNKPFRKLTQSFTFLPYFISWIVVGVFSYNLLNFENGYINAILTTFGVAKVDFYSNAGIWPVILMIANRWKFTGYGAVIYMATLTGIDSSYYAAAQIDGATKWQQIKHISIPLLVPTVIVLTILSIGRIMNADFGMFYFLVGDNSQIFSTTDVIDTFVYRNLRVLGDIGMASATGFVQSCISFILVIGSNMLVRRFDKDSAIF